MKKRNPHPGQSESIPRRPEVLCKICGRKADYPRLCLCFKCRENFPTLVKAEENKNPSPTPKDLFETGRILRAARLKKDATQRDVGKALGLRYGNFIALVERGQCALPAKRIPEICAVLDLKPEAQAALVKKLYPSAWEVITNAAAAVLSPEASTMLVQAVDASFEELLAEAIRDY